MLKSKFFPAQDNNYDKGKTHADDVEVDEDTDYAAINQKRC